MSEDNDVSYPWRVLVVDDFEIVRVQLTNLLKSLGCEEIVVAASGDGAIDEIDRSVREENLFDCIFLDWNMPEISGIDVLKYCKSLGPVKNVPIIMVTAESEQKQVIHALKTGASDYIVKPCRKDTLANKMSKLNVNLKKRAS